MYLNDYIAVWRRIAHEHKDINAFYRENDNEISDALRNNMRYPCLVLGDYDGEIRDSQHRGKKLDFMKPGIYLLDDFSKVTYDQEQEKLNRLKAIGMQIFGRLTHDRENICPRYFIDTEKDPVRYSQTDFLYEKVKGWLFEFTVYQRAEAFAYNPNDWNLSANPYPNS
jgi:hypothetical protein